MEELIAAQMRAFDERDIEAMMALFSGDIRFINYDTQEVLLEGLGSCRAMYAALFAASPGLRAEVIKSISFGNKMIVHEYIYGRNGNPERLEQVIIFEVNEGKIQRVILIR